MNDIGLAKKMLIEGQFALVVVKDGNLIFSSKDRGIKPLYTAVQELKDELYGSSVADRVTGRAAAMLCKYANIKTLHTKLISESAIEVLKDTSIVFEHDESTAYIKNRDETGMCPVEKLSLEASNMDEFLLSISDFLERIKRSN